MLKVVPNLLSVARLIIGLAFPWTPAGWRVPAVVFGALSDLVDGALSRRLHATSTSGRILDPIADKVFVLSVVVTLLVEERLRVWEVALIGLRDWAVLLGGGWLIARDGWSAVRGMPPTLLGKATTALQFVFVVTLLAAESAAHLVFIPAAVVSGAAAVDYVRLGLRGPPSGSSAQRDTKHVGQ